MPNLKDIRRRIRSVKSTQKITQAMRMVAAAKVKRAENRLKSARSFAAELRAVFDTVYRDLISSPESREKLADSKFAGLFQAREVKTVGLIIYSSDRGLCGSYNSTLIRQAVRIERELKARGLTPKLFLVGNKAIQAFTRYSNSEIIGKIAHMTAAPSMQDAMVIADTMTQALLDGRIDTIDILSTHFRSMISYKVQVTPVIPIDPLHLDDIEINQPVVDRPSQPGPQPLLEMEPSPIRSLDALAPMYIRNVAYILLLEAAASELAARMTAMSNATNNAGDMINRLTIQYNKLRQASITQEILEIVGGAEALK